MSKKTRLPHHLSIFLAILMVSQSALGLIFPDQYRDAAWIKAAWFGNDWLTLTVAVPLLIIGLRMAWQGSVRGFLLWLGIIGYALYNYAYYLFGAALNIFFPLYLAALIVTVLILILIGAGVDTAVIARGFAENTPVRLLGGYFALVGVGLTAIWLIMWAAYILTGQPPPIAPEAFKVVAAIDISLIVPLLVAGGVLLWRRRSWGIVIAAMAGIQGGMYLLVLATNSLVAVKRGLVAAPGEFPLWSGLALLTIAAAAMLLKHAIPLPAGRS